MVDRCGEASSHPIMTSRERRRPVGGGCDPWRWAIGLVIAWQGCAPASAEDWRPNRLWVAGSDSSVWVLGESVPEGDGSPIIQMWHASKQEVDASGPTQKGHLLPISGAPMGVGADAETLRVLFSDLSQRRYHGGKASTSGRAWRSVSDEPPLAWEGDASEATFWALARTAALKEPAVEVGGEAEPDVADAVFDGALEADETVTPSAGESLTLLRMRGGVWERLSVPGAVPPTGRHWLASRQGDPSLFWQAPGAGVRVITRSGSTWTEPEGVTDRHDVLAGWAGASSSGPVFVAGVGEREDRVSLRVFVRSSGAWVQREAARDGTEVLRIDPSVCGVGIVCGRLGVARPTSNGEVSFGLADLGTSPSVRFSILPLRSARPVEVSRWQEGVLLGAVLGAMTVVFWLRRDEVSRPAKLSPGFVPAAVWRRVAATMVDLAPASVLVWPWVYLATRDEPWAQDPAALREFLDHPERQAALLPMVVVMLLLYGVWCLVWELLTATTPGKRLFGCRVMTTEGGRPTSRQVILRNVTRVVMFGLGAPGWIVTLMTIVLVTRNRQRIGDLLARTVVVEKGESRDDREASPDDRKKARGL